jgi:hypothetical protein
LPVIFAARAWLRLVALVAARRTVADGAAVGDFSGARLG